jgi:hypothetical protein
MLETSFQHMECLERVILDGPKVASIRAFAAQSHQLDGQGRVGTITLKSLPYTDVFGSSLDLVQMMNRTRWQTVCIIIQLKTSVAGDLSAEQQEVLSEAERTAQERGMDFTISMLEGPNQVLYESESD